MSANSMFVNTKLFDYVNNFSNNYPNVHIYIYAAKVKQMVQVAPVKHEAKEKKLKTRKTNRFEDDSNSDKSSDNIKPTTKPETSTQASKDFVCNSAMCNYSMANPTDMHNHCIAVHKTVGFVCDSNGCHKVYNSINGYTYHIKKHDIEKPLKCSYCTMYLNHEALLQQHEQIHMAAEKLYVCQMCNRRFTQSSDVDRHKATCFKNLDFQQRCKKCKRLFTGWDKFMNHQKTMHSLKGTHLCNSCHD